MNAESLPPYHTAHSASGVGMFNTTMGKLQRQLHKGEYDIFKYAPIFESDFIQITKRGEVIDVHNRVRMVTVGIASTSPILPLPDVMLLARPATGCEEHSGRGQATKGKGRKASKTLELTRLLPLKFVRISIHDHEKQQLRLKFATGRSCYLQLSPPLDAREDLFAYWEKLIYLLRPPVDSHSSTYAIPAEDMLCMPVFEEEDRRSPAGADFQGKGDQDQVSVRSLHVVSEVAGATSAAFAGGEGTHQESHKPNTLPDVAAPNTKATGLDKESAAGTTTEAAAAAAAGEAAGAAAVVAAGTATGFAAGVALGTTAGALSVAITRSAGPEQLSTAVAGTATKRPGGGKANLAIAGAANTSPRSLNVALAGTAKTPGFTSDSSNGLPEDSMSLAFAGTRAAGSAAGGAALDGAEGALLPDAPSAGGPGAQAGRQPRKGRRERRERGEKERALRSSRRRRAAESRHKAPGDKITRKASSRSLAVHRAAREDKKEKGRGSPGGGRRAPHKGISHAPIAKESRTSHKSGQSLSTTSSGSATKRLSRISSFLRNVKANLTTRTVASPRDRDVNMLAKTVDRSGTEAVIEAAESGQCLESAGSGTSNIMETVTLEAH
ncbi:Golgi-associated RAB2 interactor protein 4 [Mirounga angustirostris]|uniref:Golgi-associated RAB2 interactor protein 4 n=1 Tax=Mirounga angustirostris TaxID=9716 RepID=UPI001E68D5CE|nr:Golgi-associated RAB2 interactor protein 4 isoform X1 [Mirounga angustirostris]